MAERPAPTTLDYASPPKILPPPNDAIGLPRREWLNRPARYAALVSVIMPCLVMALFVIQQGREALAVVSLVVVLLAVLDVALVVAALRGLNYAGRVLPVLAVVVVAALSVFISGAFGVLGLLYGLGV
jgi:hypothetical protein